MGENHRNNGCGRDIVYGLLFAAVIIFLAGREGCLSRIFQPRTITTIESGQKYGEFVDSLQVIVKTGTFSLVDTLTKTTHIDMSKLINALIYYGCEESKITAKAYYTVEYFYKLYPYEMESRPEYRDVKIPVNYSIILDGVELDTSISNCLDVPYLDISSFVTQRRDSFLFPLEYARISDSLILNQKIEIYVSEDSSPIPRAQ